jgi:valyl-tRNA synthetase
MPFISEEIWQRLPHQGESIMVAPFPKSTRKRQDPEAEAAMAPILDSVNAIRTVRSESRIHPSAVVNVVIRPKTTSLVTEGSKVIIGSLSKADVEIVRGGQLPLQSAIVATDSGDVAVRLSGVVDFAAEKQRLQKELEKARKEIAFLEGKLGRPDFVERAPAEVVARDRERLDEQGQILEKLTASLAALK